LIKKNPAAGQGLVIVFLLIYYSSLFGSGVRLKYRATHAPTKQTKEKGRQIREEVINSNFPAFSPKRRGEIIFTGGHSHKIKRWGTINKNKKPIRNITELNTLILIFITHLKNRFLVLVKKVLNISYILLTFCQEKVKYEELV